MNVRPRNVLPLMAFLAATFLAIHPAWSQRGGNDGMGMSSGPASTRDPEYDEVDQKQWAEPPPPNVKAEDQSAKQGEEAEDAAAPVASPVDEPDARFELGVRSGYGVPLGRATGDAAEDINTLVSAQVPLWVDVGARFRGGFFFGAHFSYGFGVLASSLSDACDAARAAGEDVSCRASDVRGGLEVLYHARPKRGLGFWIGGGMGWEWLSFGVTEAAQGQRQSASLQANGIQLLMLQGGIDFEPLPGFGLGPFVAFSNDMYLTATTSCAGPACGELASGSTTIENKNVHQWLMFGLRASWRP